MKIIILLAICMLIPLASAQLQAGGYITQEQLDTLNFDTLPISTFQYQIHDTQLVFEDYQYELQKGIEFLTLSDGYHYYEDVLEEPFVINETRYYIQWRTFYLRYTDWDFFDCWLLETQTAQICYNTYVTPNWVSQFVNTHYLHIRFLKAKQTGGLPALPVELL